MQAFYTNPQMAAGVGNIVEALFGNPEKAGRFRVNQLQGDKLEQEITGRSRLVDMVRSNAAANELLAAAAQAGLSANDASGYNLATIANNPNSPDNIIARALVGTGRPISPDDAFSLEGQNRIRRDTERIGDERNAADNAAAYARQELSNTGALERQNALPITTGAGATTTFVPGDPRGGVSGTVTGMPTKATAQGYMIDQMGSGVMPVTPENLQLAGEGASGDKAPPKISFSDAGTITELVDASLMGMAGASAPNQYTVAPGLRAQVFSEATKLYQTPGQPAFNNGPLAVQQAVQQLTQADQQFSDNWGPWNTPGQIGPRTAPAAPAAPAGPPPGAIDMLRKNPDLAPAFDQKYGQGAAARVLGGA